MGFKVYNRYCVQCKNRVETDSYDEYIKSNCNCDEKNDLIRKKLGLSMSEQVFDTVHIADYEKIIKEERGKNE